MTGRMTVLSAGYALDVVTGRVDGPAARTTYLALSTLAVPSPNAAFGTVSAGEYTATGYARVAVTWTPPAGSDAVETHNGNILQYGPFTAGASGTIVSAFLTNASSGAGEYLAQWTLNTPRTPVVNDSLSVAVGAATLTQTG